METALTGSRAGEGAAEKATSTFARLSGAGNGGPDLTAGGPAIKLQIG